MRRGEVVSVSPATVLSPLEVVVEDHRIELPETDTGRELEAELKALGRRETATGQVRYEAERGHDDLVFALAMAVWLLDNRVAGACWTRALPPDPLDPLSGSLANPATGHFAGFTAPLPRVWPS